MPGHDWPGHDNAAPEPIDDRAPRRHRELIAALEWLPVAALILADDGSVLAANQAWDDLVGRSSVPSSDLWRRGDWLSAVGPVDVEELRARLQVAASDGGTGSADVRLTGASRTRWSRWWWRAGPTGYLIVCAGESGDPAAIPGGRAMGPGALAAAPDGRATPKTAGPGAEGAGREVPGQASTAPRLAVAGYGQQAGGAGSLAGPPGRETGDVAAVTDALGLVVHRLFGIGLELQSVTGRADDVMAQRLQRILGELDGLLRDVRSAALGLGRSPDHR